MEKLQTGTIYTISAMNGHYPDAITNKTRDEAIDRYCLKNGLVRTPQCKKWDLGFEAIDIEDINSAPVHFLMVGSETKIR